MNEPTVHTTMTGQIDTGAIPQYVAHNIAQVAFRGILRAYNDPAIRADYERWKAEREERVRASGE